MRKYLLVLDFIILVPCTYLALISGVLISIEDKGLNYFYMALVFISWCSILSLWYLLINHMRSPQYLIKPEAIKFLNLMKVGAIICLGSFIFLIVLLGLHEAGIYLFLREKNNFLSQIQHAVWFTFGAPFLFPFFHLLYLKKQLTRHKITPAAGRS